MKREPRCFLFRFYFPARRMASTAFCTCRRFSASSKISGACCSNTAEEISTAVFEQHALEIFDEAENRLHVQKAVLAILLAGK